MEIENRAPPTTDGFALIKDLAEHICFGLPKEVEKTIFKQAIMQYSSYCATEKRPVINELSEAVTYQRIEKQLEALNKANKDIVQFHSLYRVLRQNENTINLRYRCNLMLLFLCLSELNDSNLKKKSSKLPLTQESGEDIKRLISKNCTSTYFKDVSRNDKPIPRSSSAELSKKRSIMRPTTLQSHSFNRDSRNDLYLPERIDKSSSSFSLSSSREKQTSLSLMSAAPPRYLKTHRLRVPESKVVEDLLACFQGIPSTLFKLDHQQGFVIDSKVSLPQEGLVLKLMELGYLHNLIVTQNKLLSKKGAVAQGVLATVKKMLTDYYRVIGNIHSEHMNSSRHADDTPISDIDDSTTITIRRLVYLMHGHIMRLKVLADVTKIVSTGRGGDMLSSLNVLRHHGNPAIRVPISVITAGAGKPVVNMIITWMVEGELFDPYDEFFIAKNSSCHEKDIWRDKFILRSSLIPSMIKPYQAQNILKSGKAINFLNVICKQRVPIQGLRAKLNKMRECNIIDFSDIRSELYELIFLVAEENSREVLETVKNKFKLFLHFQGLRRYILLGQGDFASYFMELVEPEMKQPASAVHYHELSEKLQTAIKATTAAHEDPDIIQNVSVKLLVASGGDWGSDIFGLQYFMDEHLSAAFRLSEGAYSHLFNFLWRTKRMEHRLLLLRKERWATKNNLNWLNERFKDINIVLMLTDRLAQEFLHFARQFHYYILFEVVECLWQKFCQNFQKAKSFDDVIKAHDDFIEEMQQKTFQTKSKAFINELRLIWDLVLELEVLEDRFFKRVSIECDLWKHYEATIENCGTNFSHEMEFNTKKKEFKSFLSSIRAQYSIINRNYQEVLRRFLLELSSQKDHELRLLSERIDYNEHYKNIDARISESMKYCRCSDLFL